MTMEYDGMSAILYARVSTDDKGQTTETQVRAGKEWCARSCARRRAGYPRGM